MGRRRKITKSEPTEEIEIEGEMEPTETSEPEYKPVAIPRMGKLIDFSYGWSSLIADGDNRTLMDLLRRQLICHRNLYGMLEHTLYRWEHGEHDNLGVYTFALFVKDRNIKNIYAVAGGIRDFISGYRRYMFDILETELKVEVSVFKDPRELPSVDKDSLVWFANCLDVKDIVNVLESGGYVYLSGLRPYIEYNDFVIGPWRRKVVLAEKQMGNGAYMAFMDGLGKEITFDVNRINISTVFQLLSNNELALCGEADGVALNPYVILWRK